MNLENLCAVLKENGFEAVYFETAAQANHWMQERLRGKTVGIGGSETVRQMGLAPLLMEHSQVYWHWLPEQEAALGSKNAVRDRAAGAEAYLSSANALAETGEIVNIDGTGNRIASTAYGHKEMYFLVGINKVVPTLQDAIWRARNVAAPQNARRLRRNTPCAKLGDRCYDCKSPERICGAMLILARPMTGMNTTVVLIREELGY